MKKIIICSIILNVFVYISSQELFLGLPIITLGEIGSGTYTILSEDKEVGIEIIEYEGGTYVIKSKQPVFEKIKRTLSKFLAIHILPIK